MTLETFILYLAIHIGLTFLVIYFTAKWTEAGKQSAIIERIEELTKKVKGVETELHMQTAAKQSHHEVAKESALQTFEALYVWNSYLDTEMIKLKDYTINDEQFESLNEVADQKYERFIASLSKTAIYLRKTPVIEAFTTCIEPVKQLQSLNYNFLYNMLYHFPDIKQRKKMIEEATANGDMEEVKKQELIIKHLEEEHKKEWDEDFANLKKLKEEIIPEKLAELREILYELVSDPTYPQTKRTN